MERSRQENLHFLKYNEKIRIELWKEAGKKTYIFLKYNRTNFRKKYGTMLQYLLKKL